MLLGSIVNFVVLIVALKLLEGDGRTDELRELFLITLGITFVNFILSVGLGERIGILALAPMVAADTILLVWWCHLPWTRALAAAGILLGANIALAFLLS